MHLCCSVGPVWIPLAADLTPANETDNEKAPDLLTQLPLHQLFVSGDLHYNASNVDDTCFLRGYPQVTTQYGKHPHTAAGAEVRRIFHKLRSTAIENFNEQCKGIFSAHEQVPTKGIVAIKRFALGAVFVYQLALRYRFEKGMDLRTGLKPFLRAA